MGTANRLENLTFDLPSSFPLYVNTVFQLIMLFHIIAAIFIAWIELAYLGTPTLSMQFWTDECSTRDLSIIYPVHGKVCHVPPVIIKNVLVNL